jgi:hypothetical protein
MTTAWLGYDDVKQFHRRAVLRVEGQVVVGQVTGFSIARFAPTGVKYNFALNGVTYSGKASEPTTGTSLDKADKIPIRFLPSDPAVNHPDSWEWSATIGWLYSVLAIFLTAVGTFAFAVLLRDRSLARKVKAAAGVVTGCTRSGGTFDIEYEFSAGEGLVMRGKGDCADECGPGARVWILYLPQKPRRNSIYPLTYFDVVECGPNLTGGAN